MNSTFAFFALICLFVNQVFATNYYDGYGRDALPRNAPAYYNSPYYRYALARYQRAQKLANQSQQKPSETEEQGKKAHVITVYPKATPTSIINQPVSTERVAVKPLIVHPTKTSHQIKVTQTPRTIVKSKRILDLNNVYDAARREYLESLEEYGDEDDHEHDYEHDE